MARDSVQLETAINTISHEYLLEFTSEYGISEMLHPELPGPGDRIVDFPEGKWRTNASKDGMHASGTYSVEAVRALDTHRTPIQKQPEALLCLVGISRRYYLGDDVNGPIQLNTCSQSDKAAATDSSGVPSAIVRSPLDFADEAEASGGETAAPEMPPPEEVPVTTVPGGNQATKTVAVDPPVVRESRKRGHEGIDANAPSKSLWRDHADLRPLGVPADVSDPNPLAFADTSSPHPADVAQSSQGVAVAGDPESENVSSPTEVGSSRSYNVNLAWQVAMGSHLRLRFEQEAKLLKKSVAQVARRDKRIQARELEIKNLEVLLETEAVSNERLSQQVDALQQQVSEEESLKAAFEDYKRQQDQMVEQRCAEMDTRLDAMSIDFDEELYPHMLTAIAGRMWVIGAGGRKSRQRAPSPSRGYVT
nr:hypothetical protein [Tanacetum cinerariifolium]